MKVTSRSCTCSTTCAATCADTVPLIHCQRYFCSPWTLLDDSHLDGSMEECPDYAFELKTCSYSMTFEPKTLQNSKQYLAFLFPWILAHALAIKIECGTSANLASLWSLLGRDWWNFWKKETTRKEWFLAISIRGEKISINSFLVSNN